MGIKAGPSLPRFSLARGASVFRESYPGRHWAQGEWPKDSGSRARRTKDGSNLPATSRFGETLDSNNSIRANFECFINTRSNSLF
jgi:hypothetical protein